MVELAVLWILTSVLYIGSAIYVQVRYRDVLPITVSIALFCFGAAIFLSVNRRIVEIEGPYESMEPVVLALFLISWVLTMKVVINVAKTFRKVEVSPG